MTLEEIKAAVDAGNRVHWIRACPRPTPLELGEEQSFSSWQILCQRKFQSPVLRRTLFQSRSEEHRGALLLEGAARPRTRCEAISRVPRLLKPMLC